MKCEMCFLHLVDGQFWSSGLRRMKTTVAIPTNARVLFVNSIIKYLLKQILLKVFAWSHILLYQHHGWTKECEDIGRKRWTNKTSTNRAIVTILFHHCCSCVRIALHQCDASGGEKRPSLKFFESPSEFKMIVFLQFLVARMQEMDWNQNQIERNQKWTWFSRWVWSLGFCY